VLFRLIYLLMTCAVPKRGMSCWPAVLVVRLAASHYRDHIDRYLIPSLGRSLWPT